MLSSGSKIKLPVICWLKCVPVAQPANEFGCGTDFAMIKKADGQFELSRQRNRSELVGLEALVASTRL
jgi:hypothetical protein